jgi:hypothetical protein
LSKKEQEMTTSALIFFVGFCIAFGLFGIYAGLHRKDGTNEEKSIKDRNK